MRQRPWLAVIFFPFCTFLHNSKKIYKLDIFLLQNTLAFFDHFLYDISMTNVAIEHLFPFPYFANFSVDFAQKPHAFFVQLDESSVESKKEIE
jgi:hypothetical protein